MVRYAIAPLIASLYVLFRRNRILLVNCSAVQTGAPTLSTKVDTLVGSLVPLANADLLDRILINAVIRFEE